MEGKCSLLQAIFHLDPYCDFAVWLLSPSISTTIEPSISHHLMSLLPRAFQSHLPPLYKGSQEVAAGPLRWPLDDFRSAHIADDYITYTRQVAALRGSTLMRIQNGDPQRSFSAFLGCKLNFLIFMEIIWNIVAWRLLLDSSRNWFRNQERAPNILLA